jgi:hypothetical protein
MAFAGKNADLLHRIESILGMRNKRWNPLRQISFAALTMFGIILFHFLVSVSYKEQPGQNLFALTNELSPYYFMNGKAVLPENIHPRDFHVNKEQIKAVKGESLQNEVAFEPTTKDQEIASPFIHVSNLSTVLPELAPEQEEKVKEAVDATKKILQESEWKEVEKKYAEVLNTAEKMKVRSEYKYETDKVNWNKLEDQLRLAYSQIDWNTVDQKINSSLAQIKLDSIQQQLTVTLKSLIDLESQMKESNVNAIPDSDITLQLVQENQQKAKDQLQKIKAARVKKIVRL